MTPQEIQHLADLLYRARKDDEERKQNGLPAAVDYIGEWLQRTHEGFNRAEFESRIYRED